MDIMTDLVARLREAIDETERTAQAAKRRAPRPWMGTFKQVTEGPIGEMTIVASTDWAEVSHHIDANDPDRVLRRCAADRKILDAWDANERELEANSAEFSRPARPMENEAERFRRLGNAKAQGWELQGRRWALRVALTGLAEAYGVEEKA